jgi:hypothetical protein
VLAREAREIARSWVNAESDQIPDFFGAFLHGSINWLDDDGALSTSSDVDIMVVVNGQIPARKPGKFRYQGLLLEVSIITRKQLGSADSVLGQYRLAGSFHRPSVLGDPTGYLTKLQHEVAVAYAKREWVIRRCQDARENVLHGFPLHIAEPFHDQVIAWLFPAAVTTHILLVAGLKNPTVRKRYIAVRSLLSTYGLSSAYRRLLTLLGSENMTRERASGHLVWLTELFDHAAAIITSPHPFAADISSVGRAVAIDGSREMIDDGDHREAVFWMVATASRCMKVLWQDGTDETWDRFEPGFRSLVADLGIRSVSDIERRRTLVEISLPWVWGIAESIIDANPQIHP